MGFNLTSVLTEKDRKLITNFVTTYGTPASSFIGVDDYLRDSWGESKIKLYRLLGGKLIYQVPFYYEKSKNDLEQEMRPLVCENVLIDAFKDAVSRLYSVRMNYVGNLDGDEDDKALSNVAHFVNTFMPKREGEHPRDWTRRVGDVVGKLIDIINVLTRYTSYSDNSVYNFKPIVFKDEVHRGSLRLQNGMKPIRLFNQLIDFFKEDLVLLLNKQFTFEQIKEELTKFANAVSVVFNDKKVKGVLNFSIHPLDFMTMSDNASDWHSCMSWIQNGCYHQGTVEMMTSNNVVCCYVTGSKDFDFLKRTTVTEDSKEEWVWNNKKWRQLMYVTKDAIISGKSYPYFNEEITKSALRELRRLAFENLKWNYEYGVEPYRDMLHITGSYSMNRAKEFIQNGSATKKNILLDTHAMYNDFLNDNDYSYFCYRNKVKHTKVICVSGKAPCLCCSGSVNQENESSRYNISYNDRYCNTDKVVCPDCKKKLCCKHCGNFYMTNKKVRVGEHEKFICPNCLVTRSHKCKCCGEVFYTGNHGYSENLPLAFVDFGVLTSEYTAMKEFKIKERDASYHYEYPTRGDYVIALQMCGRCAQKFVDSGDLVWHRDTVGGYTLSALTTKEVFNSKEKNMFSDYYCDERFCEEPENLKVETMSVRIGQNKPSMPTRGIPFSHEFEAKEREKMTPSPNGIIKGKSPEQSMALTKLKEVFADWGDKVENLHFEFNTIPVTAPPPTEVVGEIDCNDDGQLVLRPTERRSPQRDGQVFPVVSRWFGENALSIVGRRE